MTAEGIAVAHYDAATGTSLNQCQWIANVNFNSPDPLKQRIDDWKLAGCETSFVLSPQDYQLILVEAPSVDDSELKEAIRWRVKDLVSYDIATAVVDYIPLPEDAYRGRSNMIYAVVMPETLGSQIESFVNDLGLVLDTIDIPELALMNLSELHDSDSPLSRACLCLQETTSYINLISESSLYLTRQVDIPSGLLEAEDDRVADMASSTILDIQRSLDYYESQIGKPPCMKLLICPLQSGETPLLSQFRHNLGVEIEQLDLGELLNCREPLSPEQQSLTVVAVAGALRENLG